MKSYHWPERAEAGRAKCGHCGRPILYVEAGDNRVAHWRLDGPAIRKAAKR